jgi:dCMP deaminase
MRETRVQRPSKDAYYLQIAEDVARRSTCLRRHFGAVIVNEDAIVATGYGGAPRHTIHCTELGFCSRNILGARKGEHYEYCRAVHAEQNAIIQARRLDMLHGKLYLVGLDPDKEKDERLEDAEPCRICKHLIVNAGIEWVIVGLNKGKIRTYSVEKWVKNSLGELRKKKGKFIPVPPLLRQSSAADEEREAKLTKRFSLRGAVVVQTNTFDVPRHTVGRAAARFFAGDIKSGRSVALSCGDTTLSMLEFLPYLPHLRLTIHQLSVEGDPTTIHQAPATLAGLLRGKCSPQSRVFGLQLPPLGLTTSSDRLREEVANGEFLADLRSKVRRSDYVFIGVGSAGPKSISFWAIAQAATRGRFSRFVKRLGIVGEINNQVFDKSGKDFTDRIPGLSKYVVNVLTLDDIKTMAANYPKQKVVMVATGEEKTDAMRVALQNGFANVLITGSDDADRLLAV